jgi:starch synthase
MSCLKAGLVYADMLTSVSPRYAREILTPEFGCGLDGLLRDRASALVGVLNGVDYEEWNTTANPYLKHSFSADNLEGKTANKIELQKEFKLPVDASIPLFASIGRLVEQKGVDLMLGSLQQLAGESLEFVLLGTGQPALENAFQDLARRFPTQIAVQIGFDQGLSHRIEAGCDFFVMPSRFEPCGLNQMYSLRYAGIPIVRATGGLDDSVLDIRASTDRANGIKFNDLSVGALAKAFHKALALYHEKPLLNHYRQNAMAVDFSWDRTAGEYLKVYQKCLPAAPV